jgi:hypothetical protein
MSTPAPSNDNRTNDPAQVSNGDKPDTSGEAAVTQPEPSAEVARYHPDTGVLAVPTSITDLTLFFERGQKALNAEQMHMLAPLGIDADWDPAQVAVFLLQCHQRGLDPWAKQAYLLKIDGKFVYHVGIGGLLRKAEETGKYRGIVGPQWCGPDGVWRDVWLDSKVPPAGARVGILREGFDGPVWGIATYDEFAPMVNETVWDEVKRRKVSTGRKRPMANWRAARDGGKASVMLAKVATAAGLRLAFPATCAGFYVAEETEKARTEADPVKADDDATKRRRAAFDAAMAEAAKAGPAPVFAGLGVPDGDAHALLLAELDEQAAVLGRTRGEVTARKSASLGGQPVEEWTLRDLAAHVRTLRPYVLRALREAGDDQAADRYMQAPDVGPVEELFGRPASTVTVEARTSGAAA